MPETVKIALKEWEPVIRALGDGRQHFLVRKGGLIEPDGKFRWPDQTFALYPTAFHARPGALKSPYDTVGPDAADEKSVVIRFLARCRKAGRITDVKSLDRLNSGHIYTGIFFRERLKWKPDSPLEAAWLDIYRLEQPVKLPVVAAYGGCTSWIELEQLSEPLKDEPAAQSIGKGEQSEITYREFCRVIEEDKQ